MYFHLVLLRQPMYFSHQPLAALPKPVKGALHVNLSKGPYQQRWTLICGVVLRRRCSPKRYAFQGRAAAAGCPPKPAGLRPSEPAGRERYHFYIIFTPFHRNFLFFIDLQSLIFFLRWSVIFCSVCPLLY